MSASADEIRASLLSRRHWSAVAAAEERLPMLLEDLDELTRGELEALGILARRIEALHRDIAVVCERRTRGDA